MINYSTMRKDLRNKYLHSVKLKTLWMARLSNSDSYLLYRFMLHLRRYEYLITCKTTIIRKLQRFWNLSRYQYFAGRLGFVIGDGVLGEDVVFFHRGSIYINPDARVGEGCMFHGDCCIGVARTGTNGCPTLGKRVDIGIGAKILGDIYIADDIVIGANAVVTTSFYEPGITIAGIPAKKVKDAKKE